MIVCTPSLASIWTVPEVCSFGEAASEPLARADSKTAVPLVTKSIGLSPGPGGGGGVTIDRVVRQLEIVAVETDAVVDQLVVQLGLVEHADGVQAAKAAGAAELAENPAGIVGA